MALVDLLTIEEARARVLRCARPLATERVSLAEAAGRVLAADAHARVDLPPFASSAMDGYAVRSADLPGTLAIVGASAAGRPADRLLAAGEAIEISTGAVVPEGADAVIPVEYVVVHDNNMAAESDVAPGDNIRPRGGDVRAGDVVVSRGIRLGPPQLGALAASGIGEVEVGRRPRVAVLTTGTELKAPGESLEPGQIYESNGTTLQAQLESAGALVERLGPVEDTEDAHRGAIDHGLDADIFITTGGVSVGPHDLVRKIEAELGVVEDFWRIAMRPGKPVSFGTRGATLVFGLPGNPVSALVGFELFVRPAVLALQGAAQPEPRLLPGRLGAPVRLNGQRAQLVRARIDASGDELVLEPLSGQDSHMIVRSAAADALVLAPAGEGSLEAGAPVRFLPLAL